MCYNTQVTNQYRGVAQFGRAPRSGRGGRKFESCHLDHLTLESEKLPKVLFFVQTLTITYLY